MKPQTKECPICKKEIAARGLYGHLKLAHNSYPTKVDSSPINEADSSPINEKKLNNQLNEAVIYNGCICMICGTRKKDVINYFDKAADLRGLTCPLEGCEPHPEMYWFCLDCYNGYQRKLEYLDRLTKHNDRLNNDILKKRA